eukprot:XP_001694620.1 predicted protein [Chlamydomonas reinhardtii]
MLGQTLRSRQRPLWRASLLRGLKGQSEAASGRARGDDAAAAPEVAGVVRVREGNQVVAAATVTFGARTATEASVAAESTAAAAQDAVQVALLALRGALGVESPPSAVVALTSLRLPRPAAAAALTALRQQLGPETALLGCSSRLRLPDERRSLGLTTPPGRTSTNATSTSGSSSGGDSAETPPSAASSSPVSWPDAASAVTAAANAVEPFHLTLAAAHTPHHEAHVLHCETSSLPRLPHLAEALRGTRPPAFLMLTAADGLGSELLARLENLFPGSCVGAGVAAQQSARDRRLLLVGGPGRGGGSSSTTGAGSGGGSGPRDMASAAGGGSDSAKGPFQRMLLNRDESGGGLGAAGSEEGGSPSTSGRSDHSSSGGAGRRRKAPATAAAQAEAKAASQKRDADAAAAAAAESDLDSDDDDEAGDAEDGEEAAAAEVAARLQALVPPYVAIGDDLHNNGAALLAFFPRSQTAATVADHLQHVALRGAALGAVSPPATGLEPYSPLPAAPDNPYYWWPADPAPPHHEVDPHLAPPAAAGAAGTPGASGDRTAAAKGAATKPDVAGASEPMPQDAAVEEGEQEEVPSAKALSALSEGLVGLPLFPLEGVILFPGQTIQLRVFEKRYRLLVRAAMEQGAAFGLCWRGTGTTAVVRSYQCPEGGTGDVLVMLEGGVRFSYGPDDLAVLPASFGLNVAKRAEYLVDEPPPAPEDAAAMVSAARQILDGVAGALEAATSPSAQKSARTFANALHFASSSSSSDLAASTAPHTKQAALPPSPPHQPGAAKQLQPGQQLQPGSGGVDEDEDAALLAADVAEAKAALDVETASLLSLYLAPHIPVHLEGLRREWFTTRSALWRLQQEASWLRGNSRVCMAVASSVLRLPRDHPLRLMLGLGRVSPVP